jgi:hypothetical protein
MREPKLVTPSARLTGLIKAIPAKNSREELAETIKLESFLLPGTVFMGFNLCA